MGKVQAKIESTFISWKCWLYWEAKIKKAKIDQISLGLCEEVHNHYARYKEHD